MLNEKGAWARTKLRGGQAICRARRLSRKARTTMGLAKSSSPPHSHASLSMRTRTCMPAGSAPCTLSLPVGRPESRAGSIME